MFKEFPSSRLAVYSFVGLLIHESAHTTFNKRENPQQTTSCVALRDATIKIMDWFQKFANDSRSTRALSEILTWVCSLCAELSVHNSGRPSVMKTTNGPDIVLKSFQSCESIAKLMSLLDVIIHSMLEIDPDTCMKVLFDASRHGPHFNWVWLHIAMTFPGTIVKHLLRNGAQQFRIYAEDTASRKAAKAPPNVLNVLHMEYQAKFLAISDVFNFLMRKRNPELQEVVTAMITKSLDSKFNEKTGLYDDLSFAFFFKLVTFSMETLRILITSNQTLVTPWNAIRAFRQIATVEKSTILTTLQYVDFMKKVVEVIDPDTHGLVFQMLNTIIYDKRMFAGRANCPSQHPAVKAFAHSDKLQFIIDAIPDNVDRSSSIIRHLHAIAISFGEMKASEITFRFLLTIDFSEPKYMYVLMAYISTTAPFFPTFMDYMYREMDALKTLVEFGFPDDSDKWKFHLNLLNNLRVLFEWDAASEDSSPIAFLRVYPGETIGELLNTILADSILIANEGIDNNNPEKALTVFRMVTKLIEAVCSVNSNKHGRKFLTNLSNWYKLMSQLSILLKMSLFLISREVPQGITVFEEMRTSFLIFLYNDHLDSQLTKFVPIFTNLFVLSCFSDSERLFGETIDENMECLLDEVGNNKLFNMFQLEDGPSVLEKIRQIRVQDSALDMVHSGQLKRRKVQAGFNKKMTPEEEENQRQRVFVLLDALRAMCMTGSLEMKLNNSKQVAMVFVELICKDALVGDMKIEDWDLESEFIHRFVEIDRKVQRSILCDGIMRVLSDTRSFAYCLPIIKAQLAVIINDAEKNSDRSRCSEMVRARLHRWMLMSCKAGIVPAHFSYLCDLEYFCDAHETYLLLLEIWKFLMGRGLTQTTIEHYHRELLNGDVDEGLPNEKEGLDRSNFDVVRLILQNHLVDAYHLFPKLFPNEYNQLKLSQID
ncbi:unnamed protein product [Caenorhabditis bovis]|uniref:Uncharacterized protein n=1 Tax=Caenorhabditis bovis TaxID=2654633 RepID=A0A8S1EA13_9PELO|nr:unnamed protein product [Caenorhabditis bovis]